MSADPRRQILRIAHRAGNGRASLGRAVVAGVDWIETDIWLHRGRIVARHEKALGRLPILYDKWKIGVAARRPLYLPELGAALSTGPGLLLDFKGTHPSLPTRVIESLRCQGMLERAAICGQEWQLLDAARRLEPAVRTFYSLETPRQLARFLAPQQAALAPKGASIWEGLLTPAIIAELRERDIDVLAWTVNSPERARDLVRQGVSGIISDRLDVLAGLEPLDAQRPSAGESRAS